MKYLNGAELAGFIKERQAKQVRALRQSEHVFPKLAIVRCDFGNPVIDTYVRIKKNYGEDILIETNEYRETTETVAERIAQLNQDESVHGIIVQLPIEPSEKTDEVLSLVAPEKDVDGLGSRDFFDPATPVAISWLLAGYGVDLVGRDIALVGRGRLVGSPLAEMWQSSGLKVTVATKETHNKDELKDLLQSSDIIVTATGVAGLVTSDMIAPKSIVVDAGTASEDGVLVGDIAEDVRARDDITITPKKGGVGPLTVAALFDNVIRSARRVAESKLSSDNQV